MNFWFCESCGKRLSDKDLEEGSARNKQLKGVFCQSCGEGITTMSIDAATIRKIAEERKRYPASAQAQEAPPKPITRILPRKGSGILAAQHAPPKDAAPPAAGANKVPLIFYAAIAVPMLGLALVFATRSESAARAAKGEPAVQPNPQPARAVPAPEPAVARAPNSPEPAEVVTERPADSTEAIPVASANATNSIEASPPPAPTTGGAAPAVALSDASRAQFAKALEVIAPLVKQGKFQEARIQVANFKRELENTELNPLLEHLAADIAKVYSIRCQAVEIVGTHEGQYMQIRNGSIRGTVGTDAAKKTVFLLQNGKQYPIGPSSLYADDINALLREKRDPYFLEIKALLYLSVGDTARAESILLPTLRGRRECSPALREWLAWAKLKPEVEKKLQPDAAAEDLPKTLKIELGSGQSVECVLITPGEFIMGMDCADTRLSPAHKVRITRPFYMGKYPVTQAQYARVMRTNPSATKADNHPVETISFNQAQEFCSKVSKLCEKIVRLPTEAEWEYACRAGTATDYYFGNDAGQFEDYGWCAKNSNGATHPVGKKKPNAWGLYDMCGNVLQYCRDWYEREYYTHSPVNDPEGPKEGVYRIARGGSWRESVTNCCSFSRYTPGREDQGFPHTGFRIVVAASAVETPR